MTKRTSILISGAAALALLGMMGAPAEAFVITPGAVQPLDLGAGPGGPGLISTTTLNNPSADIASIAFAGGTASPSGVYSASSPTATSPYPNGLPDFSATNNANYLVAENNGTVTITFNVAQTRLDLIWGTVDANPLTYNVVTTNGAESINGADIALAASVPGNGSTNVSVQITGLNSFTVATFSASDVAFEFNVGTPVPVGVPEPGSLMLLGTALAGLGLLSRRRRKLM